MNVYTSSIIHVASQKIIFQEEIFHELLSRGIFKNHQEHLVSINFSSTIVFNYSFVHSLLYIVYITMYVHRAFIHYLTVTSWLKYCSSYLIYVSWVVYTVRSLHNTQCLSIYNTRISQDSQQGHAPRKTIHQSIVSYSYLLIS